MTASPISPPCSTPQRTLLQAEQQYAQSTTDISINLVQLYKALGGGWEMTFPSAPSEPAVAEVAAAQ